MFDTKCLSVQLFLWGILAEFQNFNFLKSNMYSDVLPTTEVDVMQGLVSRMHCVLLCARQSSCQTIFYKSSESKCFLYKYPMLERTPVNPEMGTGVYEMQGMLYPLREKLRNDKGNKYYIIQENAFTVIALIKKRRVLRNVYVCLFFVLFCDFSSHSRIVHSYWVITITAARAANCRDMLCTHGHFAVKVL